MLVLRLGRSQDQTRLSFASLETRVDLKMSFRNYQKVALALEKGILSQNSNPKGISRDSKKGLIGILIGGLRGGLPRKKHSFPGFLVNIESIAIPL